LVKEFHWTLDQVTDMTWTQVLALLTGLRMLSDREPKHQETTVSSNGGHRYDVDDPHFKETLGKQLLNAQRGDGTIASEDFSRIVLGK